MDTSIQCHQSLLLFFSNQILMEESMYGYVRLPTSNWPKQIFHFLFRSDDDREQGKATEYNIFSLINLLTYYLTLALRLDRLARDQKVFRRSGN